MSLLTFPMLSLKHSAGLALFVSTVCNAVPTARGEFQGLESRQLGSDGIASPENFLSRAYHSGNKDHPTSFKNADLDSYRT